MKNKIVGRRKNNYIAKKLSDPMFRRRVVSSKLVYNRKRLPTREELDHVDHSSE